MTQKKTGTETGWKLDNSYARLPQAFFTTLKPNPVSSPKLVIFNKRLAASMGLNSEALESEEGVSVLAGNNVPEGSLPIAQAYAGHQFGNFTMLGDGRALLIGEQLTPSNKRYDIQLKGSGKTPYSRGGDGRAALGPMLREYIISEAMHALGIPTTRSLAVVMTGDIVIRQTALAGAVLTRTASSHLRFGTFEYAARWGSVDDLKALADYALERHYPDIEENENRYLSLLQEVIRRQSDLIAKWQRVGFIHGVMNTDNMTISGETIDYGPCAFMDKYDPSTVFSSIDVQGRYAYGNQPMIGGWNLARFAEALLPLLHDDQEQAVKIAQEAISEYPAIYERQWLIEMRKKLGLFNEESGDKSLVEDLLDLMKKHEADYTNTFRALSSEINEKSGLFDTEEFSEWHQRWQERTGRQSESNASSRQLMQDNNPAVIPRNHRVEEALSAAVDKEDYGVMEQLIQVLANPYTQSPEQKDYCTGSDPSHGPYRTFCGT
ncbi:YdiU family protein [Jeotgalibacillus sp. S-D1]|uniref:protein adenylyltransferase SelO n=1 Tax=Jeotgalibacillus sp. S-D1 TaxID=2552189 RepID=UPI001059921A|nr:YdiU family protein [Jeotgalibacillus sp. S-D1]TDL32675.1 YdiU family protein [Jeotgalibacillus sp. S-D1]